MTTPSTQQIGRIRELRTMLQHLRDHPLIDAKGEPIKFNMGRWHETKRDISGEHCGTACCAAGHMPFWPAFKNDGWKTGTSWKNEPVIDGKHSVRDSGLSYFGTDRIYKEIFTGGYTNAQGREIDLSQVTLDMVLTRLNVILRDFGAA